MIAPRLLALVILSVWGFALAAAPVSAAAQRGAPLADVTIPFAELGYRDGVTLAGVAPSVTFDLPRYASLRAATLHLDLHASEATDPSSTVTVAVNGASVATRALREIGAGDAQLTLPLPLPPAHAPTFSITITGALKLMGDACATGSSRTLFLRIGRDSSVVVRTATGGTAEAFFRDYRGSLDVSGGGDDPALAAVPYRIDRLEPWHRIDTTLVDRPIPGRRTLALGAIAAPARAGEVLRISPAAFAALKLPAGQAPELHAGRIAFSELRQNLGSASGIGDLTFDVPLAAGIVGGTPQGLRVHADVAHSALPAGATATLQVLVNGVLVAARELGRAEGRQTIDAAVPASVVGPSNDLRVLVATEFGPGACTGTVAPLTASLLDTSSFTWSGVQPHPPSIESFVTALHGKVIVLVAPAFTRAAFHIIGEIAKMNSAIAQLDVAPFDGMVPAGYDGAIVFAPPVAMAPLELPVRPAENAFTVTNPVDDAVAFHADGSTGFALLEIGDARGTPLLAVTYHGDPAMLRTLETVRAAQLATQVSVFSVVDAAGMTTYDIGEKLRVSYPHDLTPGRVWDLVRLYVAILLLIGIVLGARYASRRLTGRLL